MDLPKKIGICVIFLQLLGCGELQQVVNSFPQGENEIGTPQIAQGLKEALNKGIDQQVGKLAKEDGFFKNQLVKIVLPPELQKVDRTLRDVGLGTLADEGLKILNRAAEDAVGEAIPIFTQAVRDITFNDAKNILLGNEDAATRYLKTTTETKLYNKFNPIIQSSFQKVGADKIWSNLISKYNNLPLTNNVNPDLTDYVTQEALEGVFKMIAVEERDIRSSVSSRTTDLLRKVFALQD